MQRSWKIILGSLAALAVLVSIAPGVASASQPKFEPEGGFPVSFSGSGGASKLQTIGPPFISVTCTADDKSGQINSATTVKGVVIVFTGCTATGPFGIKLACTTSGKASGEIVTNTLKGTLYYIKAGSSEVGIDLEPESGSTFAEFTCGGVQKLTVTGAVIGKLTPVNTLTRSFTLAWTQSAGVQSPESYLAPTGCAATKATLSVSGTAIGFGGENFAPEQSGLEGSETLTTSKKVIVNSTSCT